jgi:hypothetical protein
MQSVPRWVTNDAKTQAVYNALVAKVCPCVTMVHSQGGNFGFNAALGWAKSGRYPPGKSSRRQGSHGDFALDAGDCIAANPDILAGTLDVNSTCSSEDGTLAGDVAIRCNS